MHDVPSTDIDAVMGVTPTGRHQVRTNGRFKLAVEQLITGSQPAPKTVLALNALRLVTNALHCFTTAAHGCIRADAYAVGRLHDGVNRYLGMGRMRALGEKRCGV